MGIGVSDPDEELEVKAPGDACIKINTSTAGNDAQLKFATGDSIDWNIYADGNVTNDPLIFYDYASSSATMALNNGNVGIGLTVPSSSLEVAKGSASAELTITSYSTTTTHGGILNLQHSKNNTVGTNTFIVDDTLLGGIIFKGADGAGFEEGATIKAFVDGDPLTGGDGTDLPTRLIFATTPDGNNSAVDRMTILQDGNVGIGTTGPGSLFHMVGTEGATFERSLGNGSVNSFFSVGTDSFSTAGGTFRFEDKRASQNSPIFIIEGADSTGTVGLFDVTAGGTSRFQVQQDGNVGIGTDSNVDELLHVQSGTSWKPVIKLENTNADASSPKLQFHKTSTASEADDDYIGLIDFYGVDSGNAVTRYCTISGIISDVTAGEEDGRLEFNVFKAGTDTKSVVIESGGIHEVGGTLKENLLTNSGFDVWSNSTLENVAQVTITWSATNTSAFAATNGDITNMVRSTGYASASFALSGLTNGKLYRITLTNYAETSGDGWQIYTGNASASATNGTIGVTGQLSNQTWVFEKQSGDAYITIETLTGAAAHLDRATFTIYEVTPGCVDVATTAHDGWYRMRTDTDIWRQENIDVGHASNTTYSKFGSYYSLKLAGGSTDGLVSWPAQSLENKVEHYTRFRGRTVTLGAWVWCASGSKANLRILSGTGSTISTSSNHSGGSSWEWLEVTQTVATTSTYFIASMNSGTSTTAYFSQPMLVFGSSIGEGNYTRPQGEVIVLETYVPSNYFTGKSGAGDEGWLVINVEADSNGKIPKGIVALPTVFARLKDSVSLSTGSSTLGLNFRSGTSGWATWQANLNGLDDDFVLYHTGDIMCNADGDFEYSINASGSDTLDIENVNYNAVQLR